MRVVFLAVLLLVVPVELFAGERSAIPIILDTDPALGIVRDGRPRDIDDGLAIIEAVNAPRLDLLGVTIVFGNSARDDGVRVARELLRLKAADVPVLPGAAAATADPDESPVTPAVAFMAEKLARQRLTIVAIGPLTNVAGLIRRFPDRTGNIEAVVAVMGRSVGQSFMIGDSGPVQDFNFALDPAAAETVLRSGVPVVLTPFELSVRAVVTPQHLERIRRRDTASARTLFEKAQAWTRFWMAQFPGDGGFHPWDSAAIAALVDPDLLQCEARGFRIRMVDDRAHGVGDDRTGRVVARQPWLETDRHFGGARLRYCHDFRPGARARFIANIIERIF